MTAQEAKEVVGSHYTVGSWRDLESASVERATAMGYEILHGCAITRDQRIALLEALAVLERAGNYQPRM